MKILYLTNTPAHPSVNSGYSNCARNLSYWFTKMGYEVAIIGMQSCYNIEYLELKDNIKIPIFPIARDSHAKQEAQMRQVGQTIQDWKPDILLCHFQGDSWYNAFTQIFKKTVWYVPVEGEILFRDNRLIRYANGAQIDPKTGNMVKFVKAVISQTKAGQRELAKHGVKSELIYHGHDPEVFHSGFDYSYHESIQWYCNGKEYNSDIQELPKLKSASGSFIIGFVGVNFGVRKRTERLIEAFSIFAENKNQVLLILHAEPNHAEGLDLAKLTEYYGVQDKVIFTYGSHNSAGWSDTAMNILYNTFDLFVTLSSTEGYGMTMHEAMACGIPIIAPDFPPYDEFIGFDERGLRISKACPCCGYSGGLKQLIQAHENRYLADPRDIAKKMEFYYNNRDAMAKAGAAAEVWIQRRTWENMAKKFDKLFRSLK